MKQCRQRSLSNRKFRDHVVTRAFEAARKSAYLLFPKREERASGRGRNRTRERGTTTVRKKERNAHVNALTGRTTVAANSERGSPVCCPAGNQEEFEKRG